MHFTSSRLHIFIHLHRRAGGSGEVWHFIKMLHLKVVIVVCFFCLLHIDYNFFLIFFFGEKKKERIEER